MPIFDSRTVLGRIAARPDPYANRPDDHFDRLVESGIASGRYKNASEVVRDGLYLLERQREHAAKVERLRWDVRIGFDALEKGDYVEVGEDELRDLIVDLGRQADKRVRAGRSRS